MRSGLVAAMLVAALSEAVGAQSAASGAEARSDTTLTARDSLVYVTSMKSDLHNLIAAQEYYHRVRAKYAADMQELGYRVSIGVMPPRINVNAKGWSATIAHSRLPGYTCAVAVGIPNPLDEAVPEGKPVCLRADRR